MVYKARNRSRVTENSGRKTTHNSCKIMKAFISLAAGSTKLRRGHVENKACPLWSDSSQIVTHLLNNSNTVVFPWRCTHAHEFHENQLGTGSCHCVCVGDMCSRVNIMSWRKGSKWLNKVQNVNGYLLYKVDHGRETQLPELSKSRGLH